MSIHTKQPLQTLPEVSESSATGSIAALYDEIRIVLGVDLVNLIYRHLATVPGALEWAWSSLSPHFRSGEIDKQATMLRDCVKHDVLSWSKDFACVQSHRCDLESAARLTQVYNLNNSRNLIAFEHLLNPGAQSNAIFEAPVSSAKGFQVRNEHPLPAIPSWDAMSVTTRETVIRLNRLGESQEPGIVASLYRHLSLWPSLLESVEPALVQIDSRGDITRALAFALNSARKIAQTRPLTMSLAAPASVDEPVRARLRAFIEITIPKMVPIGLALESALTATTTFPSRETPCT